MTGVEKRWFRVTPCENIPVREGKAIEIAGREIAIFNLGGSFLAVENRCPHRGGPLADGIVSGTSVICPLHTWAIDLTTGSALNHPESQACLATFPVRVEQGIVCVEIPLDGQDTDSEPSSCDNRDRPLRWVQRKALSSSSERPSLL